MDFVNDVLMGKAPEKLTSYFDGNRYIQHNPAIANGLDGLGAALKWMAENNMVMVYDKLPLTLAEGDKVLCVSEGKFGAAPGEHVTFYDIFRLENRKIVGIGTTSRLSPQTASGQILTENLGSEYQRTQSAERPPE